MNYTLRTIVAVVLILFALIFGYYFFFSRQKGQYIPQRWEDFDCMYPTSIASDSLQPTLMKGSILILNQCINESTNIEEGFVISFTKEGIERIGVIESIEYDSDITSYTVSTGIDDTEKFSITIDDINAYTIVPDNY